MQIGYPGARGSNGRFGEI